MSHDCETKDELSERRARKSRAEPTAKQKIMDLLARRNHSERELRQKLKNKFTQPEIDEAVAFAHENGWMSKPSELAERVAAELGKKKKGVRFINHFLQQKGLPPVAKDADAELEKAKAILTAKLHLAREPRKLSREEQAKAHRLLANRGFDEETIRRAVAAFR